MKLLKVLDHISKIQKMKPVFPQIYNIALKVGFLCLIFVFFGLNKCFVGTNKGSVLKHEGFAERHGTSVLKDEGFAERHGSSVLKHESFVERHGSSVLKHESFVGRHEGSVGTKKFLFYKNKSPP